MLGILNGQLQYDDIATPYNHKIKFMHSFSWITQLEKNLTQ